MLKLIIAAVAALVIGLTVKDLTTSSGPGPAGAWEARAAEVDTHLIEAATADAHEQLAETGDQIKDWLLERVDQKKP